METLVTTPAQPLPTTRFLKPFRQAFFAIWVICSDSLSSLFSLLNIESKERLVIETLAILRTLQENRMEIFFTHVKRYCGILGNERADFLAKNALNMRININVGIPKCHWKSLSHQKLLGQWEENSSSKSSHTKKLFPMVKYRLERNSFFFCSFKVTRFLTGHGNFGEYLKRFHRQTSNLCDCSAREIQNVEHIIFLFLHVLD
ncbi:hypothetical protein AVEN_240464-1 [Araneus ventricosus]|uniref:Uncharacterized protein n=1 Tax=Araneus ventricosus TaxID=182803 RepID=A0A4Y2KVE3_ARAVE|nr:hypothetical protein AVEN_240464-1 [Araneus ventricosus]